MLRTNRKFVLSPGLLLLAPILFFAAVFFLRKEEPLISGEMTVDTNSPPPARGYARVVVKNHGINQMLLAPGFFFNWTEAGGVSTQSLVPSERYPVVIPPGRSEAITLRLPSDAPVFDVSFSFLETAPGIAGWFERFFSKGNMRSSGGTTRITNTFATTPQQGFTNDERIY